MLLTAALLLAAGCGATPSPGGAEGGGGRGGAGDAGGQLARAEARVRAELLAAAEAIGAQGEAVRSEPAPCREEDPATRRLTGGYRLEFALAASDRDPALAAAARRWREAGHRVTRRGGRFPAVLATTRAGETYSLQALPERGRAVLAGGTPCLPR